MSEGLIIRRNPRGNPRNNPRGNPRDNTRGNSKGKFHIRRMTRDLSQVKF